MELVGVREVAKILGWDARKVSVYFGRGKLPKPVARLAAGPVWLRQDIEAFQRGEAAAEDNNLPLPTEHVCAILWAHFEAARTGLLQSQSNPLPWAIDGGPSRSARALTGLTFAAAYAEIWPVFLSAILSRTDLPALLQNSAALREVCLKIFEEKHTEWELRPIVVKEKE